MIALINVGMIVMENASVMKITSVNALKSVLKRMIALINVGMIVMENASVKVISVNVQIVQMIQIVKINAGKTVMEGVAAEQMANVSVIPVVQQMMIAKMAIIAVLKKVSLLNVKNQKRVFVSNWM